jgi:hypothetical protein
LPAESIARAWNVCGPSPSPEYALGLGQAANPPPSSLHSKLEPGSVADSEKDGLDEFESAAGVDVSDVSGGAVSIVQL